VASSHFVYNQGSVERIIHGPQSRSARRRAGTKIAQAWKANIHRITGATDRSITVEDHAKETVVSASTARDPESAWQYLEYGTSSMRAQAPGRRAIRRG
jgi:response regulator of citrate/malate metabolism